MGTWKTLTWEGDPSWWTREGRRTFKYRAYEPGLLSLFLQNPMEPKAYAAAEEAALAVSSASVTLGQLAGSEGIAMTLLRSEAVSSSHIEGLEISPERLLRADLYDRRPGALRYDARARDVIGNIHAMQEAIKIASSQSSITVDSIKKIHQALLQGTEHEEWGGNIRQVQNWVGGDSSSPARAAFVPPPPDAVPALLEDICQVANMRDVPTIAKAALVHYQFETVHPFVDGNGRTGRAFVHVIVLHDRLSERFVPPVSLVLATNKQSYIDHMNAIHEAAGGEELRQTVAEWVVFFSKAVVVACQQAMRIKDEVDAIEGGWRERVGKVRAGSALDLALVALPMQPIFTASTLGEDIGRSPAAVSGALTRLLDAGIVELTTRGKSERVYSVPQIIDQMRIVERRLASPALDTAAAKPARPVPPRAKGVGPHGQQDKNSEVS